MMLPAPHNDTRNPLLADPRDLKLLAGWEGAVLAQDLKRLFERVDLDSINRKLRPDYHLFPCATETREITLRSASGDPDPFRVRFLIDFFINSAPYPKSTFAKFLGRQLLQGGLDLDLFTQLTNGEVALNGLRLCTRSIGTDLSLYFFADAGKRPHFPFERPRVYIGLDSYLLLGKLQGIENVSGIAVDMGSGCGLQAIALAKLNQKLDRAVGVEQDARARNVATFNAALNDVEKKLSFVPDVNELEKILAGRKVGFVCTNPPFLAAPDYVVTANRPPIPLGELLGVTEWGGVHGLKGVLQCTESLQPYLADDSEFVISADFLAGSEGPFAVLHPLIRSAFRGAKLESIPFEQAIASIESSGQAVVMRLKEGQVNLSDDELGAIEVACVESLRALGVEEVVTGVLTLTRGTPHTHHLEFGAAFQRFLSD